MLCFLPLRLDVLPVGSWIQMTLAEELPQFILCELIAVKGSGGAVGSSGFFQFVIDHFIFCVYVFLLLSNLVALTNMAGSACMLRG
jgi:hypothetical protein